MRSILKVPMVERSRHSASTPEKCTDCLQNCLPGRQGSGAATHWLQSPLGRGLSGEVRLPCTLSLCLFTGQAGFSPALHKALRQKVNLSRVCCSGDSAGRERVRAHPKRVLQLWPKSEMSREDALSTEDPLCWAMPSCFLSLVTLQE